MSLYEELDRLAWYLAHRYKNDSMSHLVRLSVEDIHAELVAEISNAMDRYDSEEALLQLAKRCMYNRMKELLAMEYGTHRQVPVTHLEWETSAEYSMATNLELNDVLAGCSNTAQAVAKLLIEGSDELTFQYMLAELRRAFVYPGGRYSLRNRPWMVARALGITVNEATEAWRELQSRLRVFSYASRTVR